jgi:hypothetical protein
LKIANNIYLKKTPAPNNMRQFILVHIVWRTVIFLPFFFTNHDSSRKVEIQG